MISGSCLCDGVTYELTEPLRNVVACNCTQCRKTSGHHWAATRVSNDRFRLTKDTTLAWYQSSPTARRGFCNTCGASLFWQRDGQDTTSIGAGTLDGPSNLITERHIYTEDKGDYYEIQ